MGLIQAPFTLPLLPCGPRVCEILCAPFNGGVSVSYGPLGLLYVSPTDLQSQMLWGLIFPVQDPWAGEPDMVLGLLVPWGEPLQL